MHCVSNIPQGNQLLSLSSAKTNMADETKADERKETSVSKDGQNQAERDSMTGDTTSIQIDVLHVNPEDVRVKLEYPDSYENERGTERENENLSATIKIEDEDDDMHEEDIGVDKVARWLSQNEASGRTEPEKTDDLKNDGDKDEAQWPACTYSQSNEEDLVIEQDGRKPNMYECMGCKKRVFSVPFKSFASRRHSLCSCHRPYQCVECMKSFEKKGDIFDALDSHSCEKPFECKYCDQRCATSIDLFDHSLSHTNIGAFNCKDCRKAFKDFKELSLHKCRKPRSTKKGGKVPKKAKRLPADVQIQPQSKVKILYECQHCFKRLKSSKALARHVHRHSDDGHFLSDKSTQTKLHVKQQGADAEVDFSGILDEIQEKMDTQGNSENSSSVHSKTNSERSQNKLLNLP